MSEWQLAFKPSAKRALQKLERLAQVQVGEALDGLVAEFNAHGRPLRSDVKKLKGPGERLRLRSGNWRVVFRIEGDRLIVLVLDLGHRSEIYRRLD